jgi:hypothetical protein
LNRVSCNKVDKQDYEQQTEHSFEMISLFGLARELRTFRGRVGRPVVPAGSLARLLYRSELEFQAFLSIETRSKLQLHNTVFGSESDTFGQSLELRSKSHGAYP